MARPSDKRFGTPGRPGRAAGKRPAPHTPAGWDHVAAWYDKLVGDEGSDYHRHVILPAALRLLDPQPGERLLDLACGQGVLARALARKGPALVLGVDASENLIAAARARGPASGPLRYAVADARNLGALADGTFDAAAVLMAVQDIDPVEAVMGQVGRALRPGGRAVIVLMHPCFRIPRQSFWGWDDDKKLQYRRIDRYATAMAIPIATRPGAAPGLHTTFYHRPLAAYLNALGAAGLAVTACEELLGHRQSEPGGRSRGENRARAEIPIFLALKAVNLPPGRPGAAAGSSNAAQTPT